MSELQEIPEEEDIPTSRQKRTKSGDIKQLPSLKNTRRIPSAKFHKSPYKNQAFLRERPKSTVGVKKDMRVNVTIMNSKKRRFRSLDYMRRSRTPNKTEDFQC